MRSGVIASVLGAKSRYYKSWPLALDFTGLGPEAPRKPFYKLRDKIYPNLTSVPNSCYKDSPVAWNLSLTIPVSVPILGPDLVDPETGAVFNEIVGYEPGFRINADKSLYEPDLEPYVVEPRRQVMDFGGPTVSFCLLFPEGEAQALSILASRKGWTVVDSAPDL